MQTSTYNCTLGYAARWGSTDGIVTNSHCTQRQGGTEGTLFGQPTLATVAGNEMLDPPLFTGGSCPSGRRCRYSDAAFANSFVSATVNRGYIAKAGTGTPTWNGTDLFRLQSKFDHPPLGSVVTKVGRTTGLTRGVVDYTCATMNIYNTDITLLCQGHASYYNEPGDSGAPVFDEGYGRVMGISWGKSDTGSVFSPFGNVEHELGTLQVCAPGYAC